MSREEIEQAVCEIVEPDFDQLDLGPPFDTSQVTRGGDAAAVGGGLIGYIDASYNDLVDAFDEPSMGGGYKIDASWVFILPGGKGFWIYNYKTGPSYLGNEGTPVREIRDWHIGGSRADVEEISAFLDAKGFSFREG